MLRDGIEYQRMPNSVPITSLRLVTTPFRSGVSKLELARELIEVVHREAMSDGAGRVWMGDLDFQGIGGDLGRQAYTYVVFDPAEAAAA